MKNTIILSLISFISFIGLTQAKEKSQKTTESIKNSKISQESESHFSTVLSVSTAETKLINEKEASTGQIVDISGRYEVGLTTNISTATEIGFRIGSSTENEKDVILYEDEDIKSGYSNYKNFYLGQEVSYRFSLTSLSTQLKPFLGIEVGQTELEFLQAENPVLTQINVKTTNEATVAALTGGFRLEHYKPITQDSTQKVFLSSSNQELNIQNAGDEIANITQLSVGLSYNF